MGVGAARWRLGKGPSYYYTRNLPRRVTFSVRAAPSCPFPIFRIDNHPLTGYNETSFAE